MNFYKSIFKTIIRDKGIANIGGANRLLEGHAIVWQRGRLSYIACDTTFGSTVLIPAFEPKTYKEIKTSQGRLFVDVGAYTGVYSILASDKFEKVISLEPNPITFEVLKRNVELNHLTNVEVVQKAASDNIDTITIYEGLWSSTYTAIRDFIFAKPEGITIQVQGIRLDGLLSSYDSIDLLKIDVEGYEINVLHGMEGILPRVRKIIVEADKENQVTISRILHNFEIFVLEEGNISDNLMFRNLSR